ncbi:amidohydrolase [Oribacterium sp. C9]|uniref:amidohydrolase n=1 Tax=Oribacterium sp. C9 TaxID=1943579 RepID=UPI00098ED5F0|nr:amidohydrolase [Oribacterium sp. C9]OON86683.1 amidohydrolase [Oribacterium sp. C9]
MKTLIYNATILTMDKAGTVLKGGWILTEGDIIKELGSSDGKKPEGVEAEEYIDARGGIMLPGFVNTHCHVSMVPFRTMGDDCPDRLRKFLFPLELQSMNRELVYLGALYGIGEMLLSGTTTFLDMYYFEDEVANACLETGIRGYLGETIIGQKTCDSPEKEYGGFEYQKKFLEDFRGNDRIIPIIAPHGTTTLSPEKLSEAHDLAVRYDTIYTLHACEMDYEMSHFREMGQTPIEFLDSIGALSGHTLAAHCIHATESDLSLMKERGSRIAHCIASNTKAGKGIAPMKDADICGVPFGLGTDGPSSGNTLSMFDQMRLMPNAQKTKYHDRSLFSAERVVRAATSGGAEALGAEHFGSLEPGKKADLQIVETESVNMFPAYNPYSALVYSANASNVDLVMADGKILVRDGVLTALDLPKIKADLLHAMKPFMAAAEEYRDII